MSIATQPELVTRPAQPSVVIPVEASFSEWNRTIEAIPQIITWIEQNRIEPASPLFYRYRRIGDQTRPFVVEIGFALHEPVAVPEPLTISEMEGGTYLTCLHQGHPDGIFDTSAQVMKWAQENGVKLDVSTEGETEIWRGRYEFFLTNPDEEPDPQKWEIKLAWLTRD